MEAEPPSADSTAMKQNVDALHSLASGPLAAAVSKLHNRSRGVPSGKDFHFFNNFDEFRNPIKDIKDKSESSLRSVATSDGLWGRRKPLQLPEEDDDDSIDWLININDELIERFSLSMDEFKSSREKEVDDRKSVAMDLDEGFQMVYGKKKKETSRLNEKAETFAGSMVANVASKDKKTTAAHSRVPFHISSIPRPQVEYNILVNNNNEPFNHVWLEKSSDGTSYIHPLERLSVMDFVDRNVDECDPIGPLPLESTPLKLVQGVNELKELASKLHCVNEFAVDLEHNQYRSFQGLTCLMQISTRTEDFIVDTLKLRIHVGPYLREVFKDPLKRKVMHGADRDIIWLQRDFGIYVCNLFDTGQASRLLQLERNSLEYLLHHFCDVNANKEYQNADWRLRPLPDQMIKYAREDTHYLLYIYDLMKRRLLSASSDENDLLVELYKRSAEICTQLYEKELLTDTTYLHIYGLSDAELNSQQLAVVAGLCQWRDNIARTEDESTGYILPNKALIEIAKQMPLSSGKLRSLVRRKHPFVERNVTDILAIINYSIANSAAFEGITEMLKKGRLEMANNVVAISQDSVPISATDFPVPSTIAESVDGAYHSIGRAVGVPSATNNSVEPAATENLIGSTCSSTKVVQENDFISVTCSETACSTAPINKPGKVGIEDPGSSEFLQSRKSGITSVQLLKKPTCSFGALFGNSTSRKTAIPTKGGVTDKEYYENKVEQIKSSVALPFHHFSGEEPANSHHADINHVPMETSHDFYVDTVKLEDVIPLENGANACFSSVSPMEDNKRHRDKAEETISQAESDEEAISPSSLSSSFEKCFQSINQRRNSQQIRNPSQELEINLQLKPFDYASARRTMKFGRAGVDEEETKEEDELKASSDNRKVQKGLVSAQASEERSRGAQPRRRQAFPPSGNRSMSYN